MAQLALEPVALEFVWIIRSQGESPMAAVPSSAGFGSPRVNMAGLKPASNIDRSQFKDRECSIEVVYSSNQDYDSKGD